jgi:hypothetical protein
MSALHLGCGCFSVSQQACLVSKTPTLKLHKELKFTDTSLPENEKLGMRIRTAPPYILAGVDSDSDKLVAEAGDSSGTQRKGNVRRRKPLASNG